MTILSADTAYDVIIIGAGAAGLMGGIEAGRRGRRVLIIDHAGKPAEKIRISGGGRCNFTNLQCGPDHFLSRNPHFCKSALSRYSPHDFIALVDRHGIAWHEKTLGQLFCDGRAQAIIDMLLQECDEAGVTILLETKIDGVESLSPGFMVATNRGTVRAGSLVIATGGPSIPKMGATGFGYDIARQFGLNVISPEPALVPLTFDGEMLEMMRGLAGVAVYPASASCAGAAFDEALLFTHRGLSGPAILQISSYWQPGAEIRLDLAPGLPADHFKRLRMATPRALVQTALAALLPARLAVAVTARAGFDGLRLADLSDAMIGHLLSFLTAWIVRPDSTEGFRTAEVTRGGVDTQALSSRTFEAKAVPGLYFIGEVIDVTGHLGGHNFQWAWSSGWCAGQVV